MKAYTHPLIITHIHVHSKLPSFIAVEQKLTDVLTCLIFDISRRKVERDMHPSLQIGPLKHYGFLFGSSDTGHEDNDGRAWKLQKSSER